MKPLHEKRKDALMRMITRQRQDESKLLELKADFKKMVKMAPKDSSVLIKHGLVAGFSVKEQQEAISRHIDMVQRAVDRRSKEILHMQHLIAGVRSNHY